MPEYWNTGKMEKWEKQIQNHGLTPAPLRRAQDRSRHREIGETMLAQNPHKESEAANPSKLAFPALSASGGFLLLVFSCCRTQPACPAK